MTVQQQIEAFFEEKRQQFFAREPTPTTAEETVELWSKWHSYAFVRLRDELQTRFFGEPKWKVHFDLSQAAQGLSFSQLATVQGFIDSLCEQREAVV